MNFLELVMSSNSSTTEAKIVKENDVSFHVGDCSGQATLYLCDPVPLLGHEVSHVHKNSNSTRNGHCPFLRHYFKKTVLSRRETELVSRTTSDYSEPRPHESFVMNSGKNKQLFPWSRHQ